MRRTLSVAIPGFVAVAALALFAPAALAQHGGGHGGGGHAGGFGGGHVGGFSGGFSGRSFGGSLGSFGRSSSFAPRSYSYAPRGGYGARPAYGSGYGSTYLGPGARNYAGSRGSARSGDHDRDRGHYRSPYRGYGYGEYGYGGYGYPYLGNSWEVLPWDLGYPDFTGYGDDTDSSDSGASQPQAELGPVYSGPQSDAPSDEARPAYGEPYAYAPRPAVAAPLANEPSFNLIFNDGHQQPVRNYALTSKYILVLDDAGAGRQQRIPLSELNLPATEKAAQQAGIDFTPPA